MNKLPRGVHHTKVVRSDGTVRKYWYAFKGGPRIKAEPGTAEFITEYNAVKAALQPDQRRDTLAAVIDDYRASPAFRDLAPSTRRSYEAILLTIDREYGASPLHLLEARGARREFLDWRDRLSARGARTADLHIAVLKRVLSWAVDREILSINKLARAGRLHSGTRRDRIWSEEECQQFISTAGPHLTNSLLLALNTGQRQGDLLKLTWTRYDGTSILIRQQKTGATVTLRVSPSLSSMLDTMPRPAETILTNSRGKPWTSDGFRASWATAMQRAGLATSGLRFHDLRGTFITRAYNLGYTINEIAEASGHSQRDAEAIIRRHYLAAKDMTR